MGNNLITNAGVEINGGCNYACTMCPQAEGREKEFLQKLPLSLFESICEQLQETGCKDINLQGSGEPLLNRNIDEYIKIATKYKIDCSIVTNGFLLTEEMADKLIDAELKHIRVSVIGYDRETYKKWMSKDAFKQVYRNCRAFIKKSERSETFISSYHLILDDNKKQQEIDAYKMNWITPLNIQAEIWQMHNWGGLYNSPFKREAPQKRSCGRPFAPYINIRAGGLEGKKGAVVPCCFVLGQDSKAVLGHLETESLLEIWKGTKFTELRKLHKEGRFDEIDYCKDCDQLYENPESLVWTNIEGKKYGQHKSNQDLNFLSFGE